MGGGTRLLFALHGLAVGKWFAFGVAGESRGLGWGVAYYLGFFSRQAALGLYISMLHISILLK